MKRDLNEIICHCEEITYREILNAIKNDVIFLESQNIMDYSLLLAVEDVSESGHMNR